MWLYGCLAGSGWGRRLLCAMVLAYGLGVATPVAAQNPPPGHGTIALEGTMKKFYRAANTIIVATIDGVEHVYRFAKDLVVHGGQKPGGDPFAGLREGSTVVVHFTVEGAERSAHEIDRLGDDGLAVTEGIVSRIDRKRKQITVRYDNGKRETFGLTDRAAAAAMIDQTGGAEVRAIIYYSDDAGQKVAHFFKKVSGPSSQR